MEKEKKAWKFFSWTTLFVILASCVLNTVIWFTFHGIPLWGLPQKAEIESVTIVCNGIEKRMITEADKIELLVKSANLLNYQLFGEKGGNPILVVTYHLKNGDNVNLEANGTTVWWHGKAYVIKEVETYVNIIQGLFFDSAEKSAPIPYGAFYMVFTRSLGALGARRKRRRAKSPLLFCVDSAGSRRFYQQILINCA